MACVRKQCTGTRLQHTLPTSQLETATVAADFNMHKDITKYSHTVGTVPECRSQAHRWVEDIQFSFTEGSEETQACVFYPSTWVRMR